jgi:hypothetical protein
MNHCDIKRVVLPLLDKDAKTLIKVANMVDSNYSDTRLIDNPSDFFKNRDRDIPVITIGPAETTQNDNGISFEDTKDISKSPSKHFASGTVFIPSVNIAWFFIPFNYKQDARKKQFENALKNQGLTLADIGTIDDIVILL